MSIPFVSLRDGYVAYQAQLDAAVQRVLSSGWYILGREVEAFEAAFAQWCGVPHAVGVANGTDAVALALRTLGIERDDLVITVSHTAVATVAAIEMIGAVPVLVDIDSVTFTIDPTKLDATLSLHKGRVKAVVAVHIYGHPSDLGRLREICARHGAFLVEDCAQAHGARYGNRKVGSWGDIAAFSFYPTKNLGAFGDGGAVVMPDAALASRCRALRQYGWHERYLSDIVGVNSRLDELQAAILGVKLEHLDAEIASRQQLAGRYDAALTAIETPAVRGDVSHAYHLYVIRNSHRDALAAHLKQSGIGAAIHYPVPVHKQKAYEGRILLGEGGMPETERAAAEVLSLPLHPFLTEEHQDRVIAAVRSF